MKNRGQGFKDSRVSGELNLMRVFPSLESLDPRTLESFY